MICHEGFFFFKTRLHLMTCPVMTDVIPRLVMLLLRQNTLTQSLIHQHIYELPEHFFVSFVGFSIIILVNH